MLHENGHRCEIGINHNGFTVGMDDISRKTGCDLLNSKKAFDVLFIVVKRIKG